MDLNPALWAREPVSQRADSHGMNVRVAGVALTVRAAFGCLSKFDVASIKPNNSDDRCADSSE